MKAADKKIGGDIGEVDANFKLTSPFLLLTFTFQKI